MCTVYTVYRTLFTLCYTIQSVHSTVWHSLYAVHCTLYSVQCDKHGILHIIVKGNAVFIPLSFDKIADKTKYPQIQTKIHNIQCTLYSV